MAAGREVADSDFEILRPHLAPFAPEHLSEIGELSQKYLKSEAAEFGEGELVSNLYALYKISESEEAKMHKAHSERVKALMESAVSNAAKPAFDWCARLSEQRRKDGDLVGASKARLSAARMASYFSSEAAKEHTIHASGLLCESALAEERAGHPTIALRLFFSALEMGKGALERAHKAKVWAEIFRIAERNGYEIKVGSLTHKP